ncbi:MAG: hypothetical protein A4S14_08655 [Proteobacteria bacterium SG_bin9]|nr:MAG: hypothetical protein A4S14_08655 [Proteobacteria bacterium SG_bin9]
MALTGWKRRLLIVVLACAFGLAAAFVFAKVAGLVHPCGGEQLSCSMTRIIGFIYTPVFSGVALIAFAIAALWKNTGTALLVAMLIPLVPFLILFASLKYSDISVREWHEIRGRDVQELLQIAIPIVLTLVVPWAVLKRFANPPVLEKTHV